MDRLPYFPMYADDFVAGTLGMTDSEIGVYTKILCLAWSKNGVSEAEARSVSRDDTVIDAVLETKFERCEDGRYRNKKLESVRKKQANRQQSGSKGGSKIEAKSKRHNQSQNHTQNAEAEAKPETKNKSSDCNLETASPVDATHRVSVQEFFDRWNRFAKKTPKLAECRKLTDKRRKQIASRLKSDGWFEDFAEAVVALPLGGDGWQPTLDYLVKNDHNVYLLLEGNFDWRSRDDPASQRLAEQKRKRAFEERQREEECRKEQLKAESSGRRKVTDAIWNQIDGSKQETQDASLLFGEETGFAVNGAEHSNCG